MKILGVDYGKHKIGLALSEGITAKPLRTLRINSKAAAVNAIAQVVGQEQINQLVVGLPESGESRQMVESFIKAWKEQLPDLPVMLYDETLTTQSAKQQQQELNISRKARQDDDSLAATILLQEYLDESTS